MGFYERMLPIYHILAEDMILWQHHKICRSISSFNTLRAGVRYICT